MESCLSSWPAFGRDHTFVVLVIPPVPYENGGILADWFGHLFGNRAYEIVPKTVASCSTRLRPFLFAR
jgi:hypothetical protein